MLRRLTRTLLLGFCVAIAAQQSNVGSLVFGDECRDRCPDEDSSHRCPPNCLSCTCVAHGIPVSMARSSHAVVVLAAPLSAPDIPKKVLDPRPDSIFHVPRPSLV